VNITSHADCGVSGVCVCNLPPSHAVYSFSLFQRVAAVKRDAMSTVHMYVSVPSCVVPRIVVLVAPGCDIFTLRLSLLSVYVAPIPYVTRLPAQTAPSSLSRHYNR